MIVIFHYITATIDPKTNLLASSLYRLTQYFNSGVDLFFIISGFLIFRNLTISGISRGSLIKYFMNRAYRILPLYFIGIAICVLIFWMGLGRGTIWFYSGKIPWYSYLLFLQNEWMAWNQTMGSRLLSIYWSLGIEVQFYALAPILMLLIKPRFRIIFFISAVIMAIVFRFLDGTQIGSYTHFYCRMDSLFAGGIIAALVRNNNFTEWIMARARFMGLVFLSILFLLFCLSLNLFTLPQFIIPSLFILMYSLLLVMQILPYQNLGKLWVHPVLCHLGRYSFGIYITHEIIRFLVFQLFTSGLPVLSTFSNAFLTVLSFGVTVMIARILYYSIEIKIYSRRHNE